MRVRHLILGALLALGLISLAAPANAAVLSWTVDVEVNTVAQGTATAGGAILDVSVSVGDTVRFIVGFSATSTGATSYASTVNVDDPGEIDYQATGSANANNLAGATLNFAALADPNAQLTDGTPGTGTINSVFNGAGVSVTDVYFLDYVVQAGVNADAAVDFSVSGLLTGSDTVAATTAQVRLNGTGGPPVPEPASMLLLGTGLAGLAGFGRRKLRK